MDDVSITIPIGGMTCAACSKRIEKVVGKLYGVSEVSVNLATEKATVIYSPQQVRQSAIKEAIEKIGFKALELSKTDISDEDRERKQKEINTLRIKFIIAVALGLPLLYISMAPMITVVSLPFPDILQPMEHPLTYSLT